MFLYRYLFIIYIYIGALNVLVLYDHNFIALQSAPQKLKTAEPERTVKP